jgi:hypothetical protein
LATERQNRPTTIETTLGRVRCLFGSRSVTTDDVTQSTVKGWWAAYKARPVSKAGKLDGAV